MNEEWSSEDRAAARGFLQRSEVRLSTLHRIATAMLSGAGLLVILPAMLRDQIGGVISTLVTAERTATHLLLAAVALVIIALPLVVFFQLLGALTKFYFHAEHVDGTTNPVFVPRFTLTGLRLPSDELSPAAAAQLSQRRASRESLELVVPPNPKGRADIDQRLRAYELAGPTSQLADAERAAGLLELVGSKSRSLAEEVAKVEFGMARHLVRMQVIVVRYVKSLLVFLVTAMAVFAAAAVTSRDSGVDPTGEIWLLSTFALWAPAMVLAVSSPVRWVEGLLRADGATAHAMAADEQFTHFERISIRVGAAVLATIVVTLALRIADGGEGVWLACGTVVVASAVASFVLAARRSVVGGVFDPRRTVRGQR